MRSPVSRILLVARWVMLVAFACVAWRCDARSPNLKRYPLRVHVLAADRTAKVQRMRPGDSAVCDSIEDMGSAITSDAGTPITISSISADPCAFHSGNIAGRLLELQDDWSFTGEGRADLVSPPDRTQAFTFRYADCTRIRVFPGFASLPARWKKPGATLEVLLPSEDIPNGHGELPPKRCTLSITVHDFVYLLLRNGAIIQVSEPVYWQHPALRVLLSGQPETIQQRTREFTVSAAPHR